MPTPTASPADGRRERMVPASALTHPATMTPTRGIGPAREPSLPPIPTVTNAPRTSPSREDLTHFDPTEEPEMAHSTEEVATEHRTSFLTPDILKNARVHTLWQEIKDWKCGDAPAKAREIEELIGVNDGERSKDTSMDRGPLDALRFATTCLRCLGTVLVTGTMLLIVGMVVSVVKEVTGLGTITLLRVPWTPNFMVTWGLVNLALAVVHEAVNRHGLILFDCINEELDYDLDAEERGGTQFGRTSNKPAIGVRITLRKFQRYADLPMIPGKFGNVVFALFNATVPVGVWFALFTLAHHQAAAAAAAATVGQ